MINSSKEYISIQEAADLSQKSIQTIRRAIKAKKITVRKSKTPQGFNYLIEKKSLFECYGLNFEKNEQSVEKKVEGEPAKKAESMSIETNDFKTLVKTLESLLNQHGEERQNFLRLVNTMQEKIFVLENQLNLLKAPVTKKWYQLWR